MQALKPYTRALFSLLMVSCSLFPIVSHAANTLDYIVAIVNDNAISYTDLQRQVKNKEMQLKQQNIRIPPTVDFERQVLENLIIVRLQLQLAERMGITVDDASLDETLSKVAGQNNLSIADFRKTLERDNYDFAQFREDLRKEMIIRRLQQRQVVSRVNVSEKDIDNFLATRSGNAGGDSSEYRLQHILIAIPEAASPEEIARKKTQAEGILQRLKEGEDFQTLAVANSSSSTALEGGDLGWRTEAKIPSLFLEVAKTLKVGGVSELIKNSSGFHIVRLADKRGAQTQISQTQARHILIKTEGGVADRDAERRLKDLKYRLDNGDDFAELAKASSDDKVSAAQGGSLDWVTAGDLVPEFEQVMDGLQKNEISDPFKTRFGWHIVQVLDRRKQDGTDKARRMEASQQIRQRKIEEELQTWLRQLREEAYVEYVKRAS